MSTRFFLIFLLVLSSKVLLHAAAGGGYDSRILYMHDRQVNDVCIDAKESLVASGSWDQSVGLTKIAGACKASFLVGHTSGINAVRFDKTGSHILSGAWDGTVRIWDVQTGLCQDTHKSEDHFGFANGALALDVSDDLVAVGFDNGMIGVYALKEKKFLYTLHVSPCSKYKGVNSLAFINGGQHLVAGSRDAKVRVWDMHRRVCVKEFPGYTNWMSSVASGAGDSFVSYHSGSAMIACSTLSNEYKVLKGHSGPVCAVANARHKALSASGSFDRDIRVWDFERSDESIALRGHTDWISSLATSQDGSTIVSGSRDKTVRLWQKKDA